MSLETKTTASMVLHYREPVDKQTLIVLSVLEKNYDRPQCRFFGDLIGQNCFWE